MAFYMHDLSGGGVERMRLNLIDVLRARGVRVTLVLGARNGALEPLLPPDLSVVDLGGGRTLRTIPKLVRFLRDEQPDVLVASLDHNNIAAMVARTVSGSATRLVICQHSALSAELGNGWKYRLVPLAYWLLQHKAHGIIAVSHGVADDLARTAGIGPRRISVIYNPVIGAGFLQRAEGAAPHPWLAKKDVPVFVFVGRLTAQKDPATLLAATKLLLERRRARLIMAGVGEDEAALRRMAQLTGIAHAVAFVGFQENPLPWIKHADALVSASRFEGFGNVLVEALACGTPVIATDCPHGPAEILLQGALGRLVKVGDAGALAEAMEAHEPANVDAARLMARAADFTAEAAADAHMALFRRLMVGRSQIVHALGMAVSPYRTEDVVNMIVEGGEGAGVRLMVTPNLDHVRLLRQQDFAAAYAGAHLVCPDGLPVLAYARLRGLKLRARVTGCEVFARLIRHPGLRRHKIFIVVESLETEAAAKAWAKRIGFFAMVEIAVAVPGLAADEAAQARLVRMIVQFAPSILVMTLGAPVSEVFVHRHRQVLPPCWALCVGQALRVELNLVRRAPPLWRQCGLEWFWRLRLEPRRLLGRYVRALLWFPVAVLRDLVRAGHAQGGEEKDVLF